ncbi:coiled-coil domain-containing protein [Thioalkalivibrio paradoxus]|uniref:Uncharacterized protein n=1 Tax=Thioalkalivibrio paradoxus ARh 1 TaxID=713585 RepID=W0DJN3_9GAMM|nr:hypothetical protein [Thioalkalivibrio paradoxus]AHE97183.1 hypothetical protein THITH_01600 [Thioalkalivibrio paradoxus ARh 1]
MQNMTEKARDRVAAAQAELDEAVSRGEDTSSIRATLGLAIEELDRVEAETEAQARAAAGAAQDAVRADAERLANEAAAEIQDVVDRVLTISKPEVEVPADRAVDLLLAQQKAQAEDSAIRAHRHKVGELRERLERLKAERAEIGQRRAAGDERPDDAARVHLLATDAEALEDLIARVEAEAPARDELVTKALREWERGWNNAVKEVRVHALALTCQRLELALMAAATAHRDAGGIRRMDARLAQWVR